MPYMHPIREATSSAEHTPASSASSLASAHGSYPMLISNSSDSFAGMGGGGGSSSHRGGGGGGPSSSTTSINVGSSVGGGGPNDSSLSVNSHHQQQQHAAETAKRNSVLRSSISSASSSTASAVVLTERAAGIVAEAGSDLDAFVGAVASVRKECPADRPDIDNMVSNVEIVARELMAKLSISAQKLKRISEKELLPQAQNVAQVANLVTNSIPPPLQQSQSQAQQQSQQSQAQSQSQSQSQSSASAIEDESMDGQRAQQQQQQQQQRRGSLEAGPAGAVAAAAAQHGMLASASRSDTDMTLNNVVNYNQIFGTVDPFGPTSTAAPGTSSGISSDSAAYHPNNLSSAISYFPSGPSGGPAGGLPPNSADPNMISMRGVHGRLQRYPHGTSTAAFRSHSMGMLPPFNHPAANSVASASAAAFRRASVNLEQQAQNSRNSWVPPSVLSSSSSNMGPPGMIFSAGGSTGGPSPDMQHAGMWMRPGHSSGRDDTSAFRTAVLRNQSISGEGSNAGPVVSTASPMDLMTRSNSHPEFSQTTVTLQELPMHGNTSGSGSVSPALQPASAGVKTVKLNRQGSTTSFKGANQAPGSSTLTRRASINIDPSDLVTEIPVSDKRYRNRKLLVSLVEQALP